MPSLPNVERLEELEDARDCGGGLAAGSMSGVELVAQSTAGIAPSAVMVSGATLVAASAGPGTLYSYAVSLGVLLWWAGASPGRLSCGRARICSRTSPLRSGGRSDSSARRGWPLAIFLSRSAALLSSRSI